MAEARVEAAPLGELLDAASLRAGRMFKIDIEGFEAPVLRADVEILVEVAPERLSRSGVATAALFEEFRAAGFHWLFVDNDYGWAGYYRTHARAPVRSDATPTEQTDVIFRRGP